MSCFSINNSKNINHGRGVTDVCWLAIFIAFCFGMVFIASFAFVYGNPLRLVFGYDSFGNICGFKNEPIGEMSNSGLDLTDRKYLFFFNLHNVRDSLKICVSECPKRRLDTLEDLWQFARETGSRLCRYDILVDHYTEPDPLADRVAAAVAATAGNNTTVDPVLVARAVSAADPNYAPCPKLPVYASSVVLNRCVPNSVAELTTDVIYNIHGYLNNLDLFQQMLSDLYASWKEMIILGVIACTLSVVMVFLVHYLVTTVYWIITIGTGIGCVGGTGLLWWTYFDIKRQLDTTPADETLAEMVHNEATFLGYSIVATVATVILLLVILYLRKEVSKVEQLFKEAGNCLLDLPFLFIQPFWTVICLVIYFLFWILVMLALGTANHPNSYAVPLQLPNVTSSVTLGRATNSPLSSVDIDLVSEFTVIDYVDPAWVKYMWWYYLIALVWISEFILACQQMVLAGTVARWYFEVDKDQLRCPITKSICNLFLYHVGSVAKGSFLITVFKVPRLILTYVKDRLTGAPDGTCKNGCSKGCACCLYCLEKCIKYINHNAYTVIAINGCDFCSAAQEALACLVKNAPTVAAVNSVGDFVLFLAKCLVTCVTGIIGLLVMKVGRTDISKDDISGESRTSFFEIHLLRHPPRFELFNPDLHFYAFPIMIVCVFAFFVSHCVLSLFEMVVDTLTLCYCESAEHAYESLRASFKTYEKRTEESTNDIELQTLNH